MRGKSRWVAVVAAAVMPLCLAPAAKADGPPAWAQRMRRHQQMAQATQATAQAVRSGDAHGGGTSVNLSESDR